MAALVTSPSEMETEFVVDEVKLSPVPESALRLEMDAEVSAGKTVETLLIDGCKIYINDLKAEQDENYIKIEDLSENEELATDDAFIIQYVHIVTTAVNGVPSSKFVGYQCSVCFLTFPTYKTFNEHQVAANHYKGNLNFEKNNKEVIVRCIDCFNGQLYSCRRCKRFAGNENGCRKLLGSLQCSQCTGIFSSRDTFNKHPCLSQKRQKAASQQVSLKEKESFSCSVCLQEFETKVKLRNHMRKHSKKENNAKSATEDAPPDGMVWQCTQCKNVFNSATDLVHHGCIYNSSYTCDNCGKQMQGYEAYRSHTEKCREDIGTDNKIQLLTQEGNESIKVEDEEENDVSSDAEVNDHNYVETFDAERNERSREQCQICNELVEDQAALEKHMQSHAGNDSAYTKSQRSEEQTGEEYKKLNSTEKTELMGQVYSCQVCGHESTSFAGCRTHFKENHPLEARQEQQEIDSNKKAFWEMERDVAANERNREKIWKCNECEKSFAYLNGLWDHKRQHRGKHFWCKICLVEFETYDSCRYHIRKHKMGETINKVGQQVKFGFYKCQFCEEEFTSYPVIQEHLKKQHPQEAMKKVEEIGSNNLIEDCPSNESKQIPARTYCEQKLQEITVKNEKEGMVEIYGCQVCDGEFTSFRSYRRHFKEKHPSQAKKEQEEIDNNKKKLEEIDQGDEEKIWQCNECDSSFMYSTGLWIHKRQHRGKLFWCNICQSEFKYFNSAMTHRRRHKPANVKKKVTQKLKSTVYGNQLSAEEEVETTFEEQQSEEATKTEAMNEKDMSYNSTRDEYIGKILEAAKKRKRGDKEKHSCSICGKECATMGMLKLHKKMNHKIILKCNQCEKTFRSESGLRMHNERSHLGKVYTCSICFKVFKSSGGYGSHKALHESGAINALGEREQPKKPEEKVRRKTAYICSLCPKMLFTREGLRSHEKRHEGNKGKIYTCTESGCNRLFTNSLSLKSHVTVKHVKGRAFQCADCGKCFYQKAALTMHMRTHTGERPFACKICHQLFRYRSHVYNHMRSHLNMRSYVCPHCDRTFNHSKTLKLHLLTHTRSKSYRCEQCGACFSQRRTLRTHERTHATNEFPCTKCSKVFTIRSHLTEHMVSAHELPDAQTCEKCGERFTSRNAYLRHMTTHADKRTLEEIGAELFEVGNNSLNIPRLSLNDDSDNTHFSSFSS